MTDLDTVQTRMLRAVQHACWQIAEDHGFHAADRNVLREVLNALGKFSGEPDSEIAVMITNTVENLLAERRVMLMVDELSELHEEQRDGAPATEIYYAEDGKPEGIPIELADLLIRAWDFAEDQGIDLAKAIEIKMEFNRTRPMLHGRKF